MGQLANVLENETLPSSRAPSSANHLPFPSHETARLIPGGQRRVESQAKKSSPPITNSKECRNDAGQSSLLPRIAAHLLPESLTRFAPRMLGTAVLDMALICLVYATAVDRTFRLGTLCSYLALFFFFMIEEGAYVGSATQASFHKFRVAKSIAWSTLLVALPLSRCLPATDLLELLLWGSMSAFLLCAWRWVRQTLSGETSANEKRNVLIIGKNQRAGLIEALARSGVKTIKFVPEHHVLAPYGAAMLHRLVRQSCIDEMVIDSNDVKIIRAAALHSRDLLLDVSIAPELFGEKATGVQNFSGVPLITIHRQAIPAWGLAFKRIADAVIASCAILLLLPLLLLIALVVKLDSPGPVLYGGLRIGHKGQHFRCFKFRTMATNADAAKDNLRLHNQRQGAFFKLENDPRITRVGHLLRRYSLDELPQLWNVLLGDMSLVGPRPHPPDDVTRYDVGDFRRLDSLPGMTGLWQVTARRDPSFRRCVALDVEYINRWNLLLDARILCRTLAVVVQGSGA